MRGIICCRPRAWRARTYMPCNFLVAARDGIQHKLPCGGRHLVLIVIIVNIRHIFIFFLLSQVAKHIFIPLWSQDFPLFYLLLLSLHKVMGRNSQHHFQRHSLQRHTTTANHDNTTTANHDMSIPCPPPPPRSRSHGLSSFFFSLFLSKRVAKTKTPTKATRVTQ